MVSVLLKPLVTMVTLPPPALEPLLTRGLPPSDQAKVGDVPSEFAVTVNVAVCP